MEDNDFRRLVSLERRSEFVAPLEFPTGSSNLTGFGTDVYPISTIEYCRLRLDRCERFQ